jgi:hypothetical protein
MFLFGKWTFNSSNTILYHHTYILMNIHDALVWISAVWFVSVPSSVRCGWTQQAPDHNTSCACLCAAPWKEDSECWSHNEEVPKCTSRGWSCDVSSASTPSADSSTGCTLLHLHCCASLFVGGSCSLPRPGSAILLREPSPADIALGWWCKSPWFE